MLGSGVLNAAPALEVHLAHVKSLYSDLKEPAFYFVDENYDTVKAMQDAVNEAERHYALDYAGSELGTVVDAAMEMHILMAAAATYVVYEDLYEYHLEIACSRYREHYGYYGGQCQQVLLELMEADALNIGATVKEIFLRRSAEYEAYRNSGARVQFTFDRSEFLFGLDQFAILAVPAGNAPPRSQLFARAFDRQLSDPIIENWYIEFSLEQAREEQLEIEATDYFETAPNQRGKSNWVRQRAAPRYQAMKTIPVSPIIPEGVYYVHPRDAKVNRPQPNLVINDLTRSRRSTPEYRLRMLKSGARVEVLPIGGEFERELSLFPDFQSFGFNLAANSQAESLEGTAAGRFFHRLGEHVGLQTQGELAFRSHHDYVELDQIPLSQGFVDREDRGLADYKSTEFQLDIGPVIHFGNFQVAAMESFRFINREEFDGSGTLGQFFFNFGYDFQRGQIGVYFTQGNIDGSVVKTVQVDQTLVEETLLKVVNQIGVNFRVGLTEDSSLEGAVGYLNSAVRDSVPGGVIRYAAPPLWRRLQVVAEFGYNESFVGPENSWRFGVGFRFDNWMSGLLPYRADERPVPVFVPRVRYESVTRIVRSGNRGPIASAGPDRAGVVPGDQVVLDGTGSSDPEGDSIVVYRWTQLAGDPVVLANANTATPTFVAENDQTYVFQLIVEDSLGVASAPDIVTIVTVDVQQPIIVSFTVDQPQIRVGESTMLRWETSDAVRIQITNVNSSSSLNPDQGAVTLSPTSTTTYTLVASNVVGESVIASVTVTVNPLIPVINTFTATPTGVPSGQQSCLAWDIQNASSVTLTHSTNGQQQPVPSQTSSYCVQVFSNTTFTLTAFNSIGESSSANLLVIVTNF